MKKLKIKTIDIHAFEWFDRTYGNSYHAGYIVLNFGMDNQTRIEFPFEYGYGDHYIQTANKVLQRNGYIPDDVRCLNMYCSEKKIILRRSKTEGCRKRDLMTYKGEY